RVGAKNTLVKNYLYLAEKAGATIHPLTTVTRLVPRAGGGYEVHTRSTNGIRKRRSVFTADQVVVAAGTYGTARLLLAARETGDLPNPSPALGEVVRTNSEAVLAASAKDRSVDYTQGIAITSSFHPDDHTHIEPVRYGKGSNVIGLVQALLVDGGGKMPRLLKFFGLVARNPG